MTVNEFAAAIAEDPKILELPLPAEPKLGFWQAILAGVIAKLIIHLIDKQCSHDDQAAAIGQLSRETRRGKVLRRRLHHATATELQPHGDGGKILVKPVVDAIVRRSIDLVNGDQWDLKAFLVNVAATQAAAEARGETLGVYGSQQAFDEGGSG